MVWMTNTLQATLLHYFYPERMVDEGNVEGARQVRAHAEARVGGMLQQLADQLSIHGGPWLLGSRYSAVDPFALMLCRWTRGFASQPARDYPQIGPYLKRVLERPAVQRVFLDEQLPPPLV
jgi:glutathione S-transferase